MNNSVSNLLQLEYNCRNCESYQELKYVIVNETRKIVSYEQAVFLSFGMSRKLKVETVSDISAIDSTSPFIQNIESISNKIYKSHNNSFHVIDNEKEIEEYEREQLKEFSPSSLLWIPLKIQKDDLELEYFLLLIKKDEWTKKEQDICSHISSSYAYFLYATRKCNFKSKLQKRNFGGYFKYIFILLILAMFIPVKLTVLAPVEIVPKDPFIVTSSLDGAIDKINVKANEYVKEGSLIVKLNDIDYLNKYLIAKKTLNISKAQLKTAQQASFYDLKQKSNLDNLRAQVELKKSELEFTKQQLDKTKIYAKKSGVAIVHNPNEWKGKPVVTGERILQIADTKSIELKIMLPVSDAIFLEDNANVKVFLDNDPLNTWEANITYISYRPELTSSNILAYKISADFKPLDEAINIPTIGLRGTAKIYSKEVSLFFYLFKKPITSLRQLVGW